MSGAPAMASWDVRLMDFAARLLLAGVALACVAAAAWWALRQPVFAIGRITVDGDVEHNSASSLQANIVPLLQGNFITLQMAQAQAAFESAPWVRRAVVRREFPNLLHVTLQEHVPVAYWGEEGKQLLNAQGEIFDGQDGDDDGSADPDGLAPESETAASGSMSSMPRLDGPPDQAAEVLAMYQRLAPLLAPLGLRMQELTLLERGNWRARLNQKATRLAQFAATAGEVAARHQRQPQAIASADLRHSGGYALRLHGISTTHEQP